MNELEKVLKDVVHGSIGAVATALEVGGEIAKSFVEKGQEIASDIKQVVNDACEAAKADPGVDVRALTKEQRAELRRQLDEVEAEEAAACDECCERECDCACECDCEKECDCGACECEAEPEVKAEHPEVTYEAPAKNEE